MKSGFGMNVADLPRCRADVLDDVLVEHELVGHRQHGVEAHVDLGLAGGADLVVLHLDLDADGFELPLTISERRSWYESIGGTGK